ncbi:hypothetical protein HY632_03760 [Candidatus Uhrbacteria bacterium]|nr:hypothetical protein [Candidatus Uhrbacteria bacterium]
MDWSMFGSFLWHGIRYEFLPAASIGLVVGMLLSAIACIDVRRRTGQWGPPNISRH